MQTYSAGAPTTTYSASTPMISSMPAMPVQTQTYASPASPSYVQQPQSSCMMQGAGGAYGTGAYKLAVTFISAQGLKHMNNFTGDHPYVVCEVKHAAHRERR